MPLPLLPAADLRSNVATWAVACGQLPAVAYCLPHLAPTEEFDPTFRGQDLATTYFDTLDLRLRKARQRGEKYLTLRLRCYGGLVFALSAKTEGQKWRQEVDAQTAGALLGTSPAAALHGLLPANVLARLQDLAGEEFLLPAACVHCRRYAVENAQDRFTLDVGVRTDTGKGLPFSVLEYKSTDPEASPPGSLQGIGLRPLKLSKFLWATGV
jgi:hypothetical protein